ncbi:M66 family metalloprotease [Undibacterium luofuense]|uniref:Dictomallein n=1 Tax=Undibacterium luofuense TaxID=2828733 RepID=A0A941DM40_9BURK|nr:M66 family metalloprotease [Undibacterium luofuense]MBR7783647.1 hypothetical protein [Undibacterium luofuense]
MKPLSDWSAILHTIRTTSVLSASAAAILLSACGGGGGGDSGSSSGSGNNNTSQTSQPALGISKLELAQTHVIPAAGLSWQTKDAPQMLIAGQRDTLLLVRFAQTDVSAPVAEIWNGQQLLGKLTLNPPLQLPPSEGADSPYASDTWSVTVPAAMISPGMRVRFIAGNYSVSSDNPVAVGPDTDLTVQILPFVLFGATEANTGLNFSQERLLNLDSTLQKEGAATFPASRTVFSNHPVGMFQSDFLVIPPNNNQPARVATSKSDIQDTGFLVGIVNDLLYRINIASGDAGLNKLSYASVIAVDNTSTNSNKLSWIGNGVSLVGSGSGTGGNSIGFLLHEGGHGMGLGHSAGESLENPAYYPYQRGSLKGSAWAYNDARKQLRSPLMPKTAPDFNGCAAKGYVSDDGQRCYRMDPMDHADDGFDPSYRFSIYSDYNAARIQRWIAERVKIDNSSPTKLAAWDKTTQKWLPYTPKTEQSGAWGLNGNLPVTLQTPMAQIALTYSNAGTAGASRFYPPVIAVANASETIDPTNPAQLAKIYPYNLNGQTPPYTWYCHGSGCDFTVRVSFSDGSQQYRVLQGGFRQMSAPETYRAEAKNPNSRDSFEMWALNVPAPANSKVVRLELLDTPKVWSMSSAQIRSAPVLISATY